MNESLTAIDYVNLEALCYEETADNKEYDQDSSLMDVTGIDCYQQYIRDMSVYPCLSEEEEKELLLRVKAGDMEARNRLVCSYWRLVVKWAGRYHGDRMDLIQDGNLGLIKAAQKFDFKESGKKNKEGIPSGKGRFSTYATWWIRAMMREGLTRYSDLTDAQLPRIAKIRKAQEKLQQEQATEQVGLKDIARETGLTVREVEEGLLWNLQVLSLDQTLSTSEGDNNNLNSGPVVYPDPDPGYNVNLADYVNREFQRFGMTERELEILRCRYPLISEKPLTLKETFKKLNISVWRVLQVEQYAMPKYRKMYESYCNNR